MRVIRRRKHGLQRESGSMDQDLDRDVKELIAECIALIEDKGLHALEDFCAGHPEHAALIRSRVRVLLEAGMLESGARPAPESWPRVLGDFRLVQQLASGGMGVVFLAEQISVGRRVALKLVRPDLLFFPGARERFRREIEAVARLSHPNIVSVYTVGEEQGLPFLAMELVEGISLADAVVAFAKRQPAELRGGDLLGLLAERNAGAPPGSGSKLRLFAGSWAEACMRVFVTAASAVGHAHARGVLHRDIKPSNILLTPGGRVVVVDFGLAAVAGTGRLTRTGSQLGSLPYMAPEQLRGDVDALCPATDVYGLGVALYEMLALSLPYVGDTSAEIERAILAGVPPSLRARNRQVSRDLETVCWTALDPDPARRYASAEAFALDLERVLESRPIEARRPGAWGRLRRFVRRHPNGTAALALGSILVLGTPVVWAKWREREHSTRVQIGQSTALAAGESRTSLDLALETLAFVTRRASTKDLGELTSLMQRTSSAFDELVASGAPEVEVAAMRSRVELALGNLLLDLGRRKEAEDVFQGLIETYRRLSDAGEVSPEWIRVLATGVVNVGSTREDEDAFEMALASYDEGCALFRSIVEDPAQRREALWGLCTAEYGRARMLRERGRLSEMEEALRAALGCGDDLTAEGGDPAALEQRMGRLFSALGEGLEHLGRTDEAIEALERAIGTLQPLAERDAENAEVLGDLATAGLVYGRALDRLGRAESALPHVDRSVQIYRDLAQRYPEIPEYSWKLAVALSVRAYLAGLAGDPDRAEALFDEGVATAEELVRRFPEPSEYRMSLAALLYNRAQLVQMRGDEALSLAGFEAAFALSDTEGPIPVDPPLEHDNRIWFLADLALARLRNDRLDGVVDLLERATAATPGDASLWRALAEGWARCAILEPGIADPEGHWAEERALADLARAVERGWRDLEDLETNGCWESLRESPDFEALLTRLVR